ncbi:hypothetical protein B0J12DRAFT_674633 [Macrophomina phaseolina]|uniref:Uncharacterized protein n=1 Tax=Macrophomina phaseolina TaxID=35725 RepID=A0ABQ8G1D4_9PEZI|nr:hypothetical protein B0J12DRAFT_674633 [Macrophomina phaseolina]
MRSNSIIPFLLSLSTAASTAAIPTDAGPTGQLNSLPVNPNHILPEDFPAPPDALKKKAGGLPGGDLTHSIAGHGAGLPSLPSYGGYGEEGEHTGDESYGPDSDDEDDDSDSDSEPDDDGVDKDNAEDDDDEDDDDDDDEKDPSSEVSGSLGHGLSSPGSDDGDADHSSHSSPSYAVPSKRQVGLDSLTGSLKAVPVPGAGTNSLPLDALNPLGGGNSGHDKRQADLSALTGILSPDVLTSGLGNVKPDEFSEAPADALDQVGRIVPGVGDGVGHKRAAQLPGLDAAGGLTHNVPVAGGLGKGGAAGSLPLNELSQVGKIVPGGVRDGFVKRAVGFTA